MQHAIIPEQTLLEQLRINVKTLMADNRHHALDRDVRYSYNRQSDLRELAYRTTNARELTREMAYRPQSCYLNGYLVHTQTQLRATGTMQGLGMY